MFTYFPSLDNEQRVRTAWVMKHSLHMWEERILIDKKIIIKVMFDSGFLISMWLGIMTAILYLNK